MFLVLELGQAEDAGNPALPFNHPTKLSLFGSGAERIVVFLSVTIAQSLSVTHAAPMKERSTHKTQVELTYYCNYVVSPGC